jgi:hypothetical protein
MPHRGDDTLLLQDSYAIETMGNVKEYRNATIQQVAQTLKSDASSCFLHRPEVTKYEIDCYSRHGGALFTVEKLDIDREGSPKLEFKLGSKATLFYLIIYILVLFYTHFALNYY